jgi:hypothetical protein
MDFTKITIQPSFFDDRPRELLKNKSFTVTTLRYSSGVCGIKIQNEKCSLVILPYMGMQIWFAEFCGRNLTMKSIFEEPLATAKYGDNYGAFLLHCGLTNMGCPAEGEDYPLHGELPFARYQEVYTGTGRDDKDEYLALGGTYIYKNSQEYYYAYTPELRLYRNATVAEMFISIENRRTKNPLDYMFMCHINWLAAEGSRIVYSAPGDREHIAVYPTILGEDSERAQAIKAYGEQLAANPLLGDILDSKTQAYDPEMCLNYTYRGDEQGWAHAMQVMPEGDACYVTFRLAELPYALRWICRTGDEDGIGIALPSTGNHLGTRYQKEHGLFNTIPPQGSGTLRFNFGYLPKAEAEKVEQKIKVILEHKKT